MIEFFKKIWDAIIEAQEAKAQLYMKNKHWPRCE